MRSLLTFLGIAVGFVAGIAVGAKWAGRRVRTITAELFPASPPAVGGSLPDALSGLETASTVARDEALATTESLGLIRRAMDSLPFGVVVLEQGSSVDWRNAAARTLLKSNRTGMVINGAVRRQRAAALAGNATTETINVVGPPRKVLVVSAVPIAREGVGTSGAVVIEDITARAQLEAVRKDFVANISHELRTPIGALALLAETLEDESDLDVVHRLSGKLVGESHRVARIIDDLLELSMLESGPVNALAVESVAAVVGDALERVGPLASSRSIGIDLLPISNAMKVPCDRRQLVSALSHLMENAVKYSEPGANVVVKVEEIGSDIVLSVEDHGVGIPARDVHRIFERFYRVDPARSRNTGGTGLGLAIVRHVASNHHGEVTVSSTEGMGSTFVLRIPANRPVSVSDRAS